MYFRSTPDTFRKIRFLPRTSKPSARTFETFAEYCVCLHGHFIPASVEVWELDVQDGHARKM